MEADIEKKVLKRMSRLRRSWTAWTREDVKEGFYEQES